MTTALGLALTPPALAAAAALAFTLAARIGAARVRGARDCGFADDDLVPWHARAADLAREWVLTLLVLAPFPTRIRRTRGPCPPDSPPPVLLVPGYAQRPAHFVLLARRLRRDGWTRVHAVRHCTVFGDLERSAARLGEAIERVRGESGAARVDIVAHGLGGLVARAWLRRCGTAGDVRRLVTLGTPHQGTEAFARCTLRPLVRQLRPGSPWLRALAADDPVPALVDVAALGSAEDDLVVPAHGARYPGAFNIEVRGVGHFSLLVSRRVYELVRENLAAGIGATETRA